VTLLSNAVEALCTISHKHVRDYNVNPFNPVLPHKKNSTLEAKTCQKIGDLCTSQPPNGLI